MKPTKSKSDSDASLPEASEIQRISLMKELERAKRELEFIESGGYGVGPSWLYLLGWADWKGEVMRIEDEISKLGRS